LRRKLVTQPTNYSFAGIIAGIGRAGQRRHQAAGPKRRNSVLKTNGDRTAPNLFVGCIGPEAPRTSRAVSVDAHACAV